MVGQTSIALVAGDAGAAGASAVGAAARAHGAQFVAGARDALARPRIPVEARLRGHESHA